MNLDPVMTVGRRRNRLAFEKSPYLLQHADNPVDWRPWGEEAFRKAKEETLTAALCPEFDMLEGALLGAGQVDDRLGVFAGAPDDGPGATAECARWVI